MSSEFLPDDGLGTEHCNALCSDSMGEAAQLSALLVTFEGKKVGQFLGVSKPVPQMFVVLGRQTISQLRETRSEDPLHISERIYSKGLQQGSYQREREREKEREGERSHQIEREREKKKNLTRRERKKKRERERSSEQRDHVGARSDVPPFGLPIVCPRHQTCGLAPCPQPHHQRSPCQAVRPSP